MGKKGFMIYPGTFFSKDEVPEEKLPTVGDKYEVVSIIKTVEDIYRGLGVFVELRPCKVKEDADSQ